MLRVRDYPFILELINVDVEVDSKDLIAFAEYVKIRYI